ncbi:MAG: permease-like cell division protein FtsX, partial [Microbacterium sp.]
MRLRLILIEALTGLRRNASMVISVVLVTFVSLTFVGAAMLMQMQIGKMRDYWVDRAQISVVMCREDSTVTTCADGAATQEQLDAVAERLDSSALTDIVRDVRFESAEEAYQNLLDLYGDEYKDYVTPEQLGETYWVGLVDPDTADVLTEAFTGMDGVESVQNQMQYLEPLFSALTVATYIAVGIAALMLI